MHNKYLLEEKMTVGKWQARERVLALRESSTTVCLNQNLDFPES